MVETKYSVCCLFHAGKSFHVFPSSFRPTIDRGLLSQRWSRPWSKRTRRSRSSLWAIVARMIPSKWLGRNSVVPSAEYAFPSTLVRNRSQTMPVFRQQPERILHISATTTSGRRIIWNCLRQCLKVAARISLSAVAFTMGRLAHGITNSPAFSRILRSSSANFPPILNRSSARLDCPHRILARSGRNHTAG